MKREDNYLSRLFMLESIKRIHAYNETIEVTYFTTCSLKELPHFIFCNLYNHTNHLDRKRKQKASKGDQQELSIWNVLYFHILPIKFTIIEGKEKWYNTRHTFLSMLVQYTVLDTISFSSSVCREKKIMLVLQIFSINR